MTFLNLDKRGTANLAANDLLAQYSSVQPATAKAKTAIKHKFHQSPDQFSKMIGMIRGPHSISNTTKKQQRNVIKIPNKGANQVRPPGLGHLQSPQFDRLDSGISDTQAVLPEGHIKQIKTSFLEKVSAQPENRNLPKSLIHSADIT